MSFNDRLMSAGRRYGVAPSVPRAGGGNKGVRSGGNYTHCITGGSPTPCFYSGPRPQCSIIAHPGGESREETADYFLTMLSFLSSRRVNMGCPFLCRGWEQPRFSTDWEGLDEAGALAGRSADSYRLSPEGIIAMMS